MSVCVCVCEWRIVECYKINRIVLCIYVWIRNSNTATRNSLRCAHILPKTAKCLSWIKAKYVFASQTHTRTHRRIREYSGMAFFELILQWCTHDGRWVLSTILCTYTHLWCAGAERYSFHSTINKRCIAKSTNRQRPLHIFFACCCCDCGCTTEFGASTFFLHSFVRFIIPSFQRV